jgi:hypothetical protein
MAEIENIEMDAYREQLVSDVKKLVEKYRSIFGWNVPDNDQTFSDKLILAEMRKALDEIDANLLKQPQP